MELSYSAAEAASPGAKPHRARQGYAGGLVGERGGWGWDCLHVFQQSLSKEKAVFN